MITAKDYFDSLKTHSCPAKHLIPSDDPSNDIWEAATEGREPKKYPTVGYTCQGCGADFRVNLKDLEKVGSDDRFSDILKSAGGRKKLGELLSK